jgi:NAD(P)-dependent dehydrogenase (short-subunit alcohol dehydrogenase family)
MPDSRLIVITGVSRGLGRAMTEGFIRAGHRVAGCARSNQAIAELGKQFPAPHRFAVVDVSDHQQVESWTTGLLGDVGPPDMLINSAALINETAPLWAAGVDEFSQMVDTNIKGVFYTIRHFVPAMIGRGRGVIVNFSSGWGRSTSPGVAAYCTTKRAIEGLSRGLADDLPETMASVALNPGVIHTDMLEICFSQGAASYPEPEAWGDVAVPYILGLGPEDNGQSLSVPGF